MFSELSVAKPLPLGWRLLCVAVIVSLTVGLAIIVTQAGDAAPGLREAAAVALPDSGVENPITAVLLNFRSYDTLLEIAVLLLVVIAVMPINSTVTPIPGNVSTSPVLAVLIRLLVPVIVLFSAFLLWVGAYAPGGAFQAGALLAGAGVLLSLAGRRRLMFATSHVRWVLVGGLGMFLIVGVAVMGSTGTFLEYPGPAAGALILLIETAATITIAATLLLLYATLAVPASSQQEEQS